MMYKYKACFPWSVFRSGFGTDAKPLQNTIPWKTGFMITQLDKQLPNKSQTFHSRILKCHCKLIYFTLVPSIKTSISRLFVYLLPIIITCNSIVEVFNQIEL